MDFSYSETHKEIKELAGDILQDFSAPDRLKGLEEQGPYLDSDLWEKLIETSIASASLPSTVGGMDMDFTASALVAEVIGQTMVSIPYIPCIVATALPLTLAIDNEQVKSTLQGIAQNGDIVTPAFIEPYNEVTLAPSCSVSKEGDDWVIDGIKHCVPYAAQAKALLVSGVFNGELWLGLIDTSQAGLSLVEQMVTSNEPQYQVTLKKAQVQVIAQGDDAKSIIKLSDAMTMAAYSAMSVGIVEKMTKIASEYTSQREQFGVPVATFQSVAHKLASCYIETECLRMITLKSVSDVNQGNIDSEYILMAKAMSGDILHRVSHATQHVHGGMGVDRDYHLFRFCLWSKQIELSLGNSKQHIASIADRLEEKYLAR